MWTSMSLLGATNGVHDCPYSTPKWSAEGVRCLRTSNLTKGGWDWRDSRFVTESENENRSKRGRLEAGDTVLSREAGDTR